MIGGGLERRRRNRSWGEAREGAVERGVDIGKYADAIRKRGAASFTGAINLHPVLNRAVKRISSDGDPESAFQAKDLPLEWLLSDGSQDPEGQHRAIFREGDDAALRAA